MKKWYSVYDMRKRILTYIYTHTYIDQEEPHWDILRYTGDILFYIGLPLLLYDYHLCTDPRILVMGKLSITTLMTFIVNPQLSTIYFMGTNQAFIFFLLVGGFMNIFGTLLSNKTRPRNKLQQWTHTKIQKFKTP